MSIHRNAPVCFAILFVVGTAQSVSAMETEVTLNQDKAISGGITPGDAPGFPTTTGDSVNTVRIMNGLIAGFGTAINGKDLLGRRKHAHLGQQRHRRASV